ncbi:IS66 family insertion sequence element accessory protein TnpB [Ectobacillus antri]
MDSGKLQWPKNEKEVRNLSQQELRWLLEGLSIQQPKAIPQSPKGVF